MLILQAFAQEAAARLGSPECCSDTSLRLGAQSLSNMLYAYALLNHHPGTDLLSGENDQHLFGLVLPLFVQCSWDR